MTCLSLSRGSAHVHCHTLAPNLHVAILPVPSGQARIVSTSPPSMRGNAKFNSTNVVLMFVFRDLVVLMFVVLMFVSVILWRRGNRRFLERRRQ